jgi:hypothetical protein
MAETFRGLLQGKRRPNFETKDFGQLSKAVRFAGWLMGVFRFHLKMATDPAFETLRFLVFFC